VSKVALVLAGLALVLVIAALVTGRVELGNFLPGILVVAAIAILGAIFTLRSHQSGPRKAMVVTAIVLVVAAAIPASLKVVYPVYDHFFGQKSAQASHAGTAGSGSGPAGSGPEGPSSGSVAEAAKSGILVMSEDNEGKINFGYFDASTGKYTQVSSFNIGREPEDAEALQVSPDLTKYATKKAEDSVSLSSPVRVGWIDTSGKFTAASPAPPPPADFQRSAPPRYSDPVFDGAGNFYYRSFQDGTYHLYKLPSGATSNPQEVPTPHLQQNPLRNFDGTLNFGCPEIPGKWLGSDGRITVTTTTGSSQGFAIVKYPVAKNSDGCPYVDRSNLNPVKIFDLGVQNAQQPVANPDGTKIAFFNSNSPGGLYVVGIGGDSKPTRIADQSALSNLGNLKLLRWT
jgi:hypothetical protein